jgi:hypothetical protein
MAEEIERMLYEDIADLSEDEAAQLVGSHPSAGS